MPLELKLLERTKVELPSDHPKYKFRHPKYKFRPPKYSDLSSATKSISSRLTGGPYARDLFRNRLG